MPSKSILRSADWTRLSLELAVVVLGILLALGIDSWWAERQERALEISLLTQLEADLARADEHQADVRDARMRRAALGLFHVHENLRWLQTTIVESTQNLRAEVRRALEGVEA